MLIAKKKKLRYFGDYLGYKGGRAGLHMLKILKNGRVTKR